nr:putative reverse transcriptase domain-containing protein [Tanacetum cinerariifolium]
MKLRRARAMSMKIHSSIKARLLEAQIEASKVNEAHTSKYSVHPRADKMYYDLRDLYWWPRMKKDIILYLRERKIIGPEIIQETTDKIVQIKERLKTARDHQKSYADHRQKPLEFGVGDKVLLKVSPRKDVVAYRLRLPQELGVYDTFHVSHLKKCMANVNLDVPLEEVNIDDKLHFAEEPMEIMDREVKKLKKRQIPIVKFRWNFRRGLEITWEREDEMKRKYP